MGYSRYGQRRLGEIKTDVLSLVARTVLLNDRKLLEFIGAERDVFEATATSQDGSIVAGKFRPPGGGKPVDLTKPSHSAVAWALTRNLRRLGFDTTISRESISEYLRAAISRGLVRFEPAPVLKMSEELERRFPKVRFHVVHAPTLDHVAERAAELAWEELEARSKRGISPGIGLAAGQSCRKVARELARRAVSAPMAFTVQALSGTSLSPDPRRSPSSFMALFPKHIRCIGLHVPRQASEELRELLMKTEEVSNAREAATGLDIVVTSMSSADDKHGYVTRGGTRRARSGEEVEGDVLFAAFSRRGPEPLLGETAIALLDIEGLERLTRGGARVILIAARCSYTARPGEAPCNATKTRALRVLLETESLTCFSDVVLDSETGTRLLDVTRPAAGYSPDPKHEPEAGENAG